MVRIMSMVSISLTLASVWSILVSIPGVLEKGALCHCCCGMCYCMVRLLASRAVWLFCVLTGFMSNSSVSSWWKVAALKSPNTTVDLPFPIPGLSRLFPGY